ncbi:hypothetical protein H2509_14015 [Stappia sp. F7233]|uniref:Uncharacterized protein n=1 Tax=Stappia albiluteola TaxID=2758565 RepID=A0A839AEK0_9HYPH|nr:hypothetical protein [Stappia albiluteola]MBA5778240.1 hypothetical protein [Stappia albiluteola]
MTMKLDRATTDYHRSALKQAMRRQVRRMHGQEAAAAITRVSGQTLSDYGNADNPRHADTHCPVDVMLDLTLDGGPVLLSEICRLAGGSFVPLPRPDADAEWAREIAAAVRECGEAASVLCLALGNGGTVTADEIREMGIMQELSEGIDALCTLRAHCERVMSRRDG